MCMREYTLINMTRVCVHARALRLRSRSVADEAYVTYAAAVNDSYYAPTSRSNKAPTTAAKSVILSTSPDQREYPISRVLK